MPKGKKSFVLHKDSLTVLDELTDEEAGKLFKAIKAFQCEEETQLDSLTRIAFHPFKAQFERDIEAYKEAAERNRQNGKRGGRPKSNDNPENPVGFSETENNPENPVGFSETETNQTKAKKADSGSGSGSGSGSEKKETMPAKANIAFEIFRYWCEVMGKNPSTSKLTPKRDKNIKARLKEGYTPEQIKQAIDGCRSDPFSMGQNDRQKPFNDIELICRTGEKLEQFMEPMTNETNIGASNQPGRKLSPVERQQERIRKKYGGQPSGGLGMAEDDGDLWRPVEQGERGGTIIDVDPGTE